MLVIGAFFDTLLAAYVEIAVKEEARCTK